jgi:hypothetical protein
MKVFLSWSGESSRALAAALNKWLASVFPDATFWTSTLDIGAGIRWGHELDRQLESTHFGILCLVPSNLTAPWLIFEAGALSKSVDVSRVVPYCLGLAPESIEGPLRRFQGISADEAGTRKLIESINSLLERKRTKSALARLFDKRWPDLKPELERIPTVTSLDILDARLIDFIDYAERPAYLTDNKLIVRHCNKQFLAFIGARHEQIIGRHVETVANLFEKLVPPQRVQAYRERQSKVINDGKTVPYARISEVVDLSRRSSGMSKQMFYVWVQADFIYANDKTRPIGSVVTYDPVEVTTDSDGKLTLPELNAWPGDLPGATSQ